MTEAIAFTPGNYRYMRGVRQYSCGVAADPGYRLERARFSRPLPLKEGFERIEAHLHALGRPLTAFAACELRSPAPFTEEGFRAFNDVYIGTLKDWGIYEEGGDNPVARSNVCPEFFKPSEPSLHAFSYTVAHAGAAPSFVVAGSAEAAEGKGDYRDNCVRLGDTSREGLHEKGRWVLGEMSRRMKALGFTWDDTTGVQLYTVHPIQHVMAREMAPHGVARHGVDWHFNRPPVNDLEFEMDCRGVGAEYVLAV